MRRVEDAAPYHGRGLFIKGTNVFKRSRSQIATLNNGRGHNTKYRFLVIDRMMLIHVGASFNYLGKKCFAFSSMDKSNIPDIVAKI